MAIQHSVTTPDGLTLAAFESGPPTGPTIVLVHGYPDNHHVWDGLVAELSLSFRVITYDVRGAGSSDAPNGRAGYAIPRLVEDLGAVLDQLAPAESVHLVAHDWGSIQCWDALPAEALGGRLLSYTSISGPSLDMAARWLRDRSHLGDSLRQLAASYYIGLFQIPVLPELATRRGVLARLVAHSQHSGPAARPATRPMQERDAVNGLELYRANFVGRMARPQIATITVPVQVLAPRDDAHVTAALQMGAPIPYVARLRSQVIEGNHWVVEQDPGLIASHVTSFISAL